MPTLKFNIIGDWDDTKKWENKKQIFYNTEGNFRIEYSEEDEIRMGLWASFYKIFNNNTDITDSITKEHKATIPDIFDPLSFDTNYVFIPSCPTNKNNSSIVLNTISLKPKFLSYNTNTEANQFSKIENKLLITGYNEIILYDCELGFSQTVFKRNEDQKLEFSFWSNDCKTFCLIYKDYISKEQYLVTYNLKAEKIDKITLTAPDKILGFDLDKYRGLIKDSLNLFNAQGDSFAAFGENLNRWIIRSYNKKNNSFKLKAYFPVSDIYKNKNWKSTGIDIIQKEVDLIVGD